MGLESKKAALIRVLQILSENTDKNHLLKQEDIINILERDYDIEIKRRAVSDNIALLQDVGYDIRECKKKGYYLATRTFTDSELKMLIDGVLSSRYITNDDSKVIIKKLKGLSNRYFDAGIKNVCVVDKWTKTENEGVLKNIHLIDKAIKQNKRITFSYNKYGVDMSLHKSKDHLVSPYQLILKNQRYYLMSLNEKQHNLGYYRLDHITDIKITDMDLTPMNTLNDYNERVTYKDKVSNLPYMFSDKLEAVEFYCEEWAVDQVVDWFGKSAKITLVNDRIKVKVITSPMAMECWAMQYLNGVEIISPIKLRDKIKENLIKAIEKYSK